MPSQICPVQIKGEWEDLITEIARSQSKSFALFAIDEKYKKKGSITPADFLNWYFSKTSTRKECSW